MFSTLHKLLALIRFSHTVFALPFALLAAVMAWRLSMQCMLVLENASVFSHSDQPAGSNVFEVIRWEELLGILFCMVFARSAAMAFNRLADRKIDAANPRTAGRHLPLGDLGVPQVVAFAAACSLCFVASTIWFLPNWLPLYLSIPVLVFLFGYSLTKRFTALSHFWLGMARRSPRLPRGSPFVERS